jgi:6-phosphogluconate dehydrogenase
LANEAKGTKVVGAQSLKEMVSKLKKPRRIILLVKAGQAVDDFIEKLVRPAPFSAPANTTELFLCSFL